MDNSALSQKYQLILEKRVEPNPEDPKDREFIEECAREAARQFTGSPVAKRRPFNSETTRWLDGLLDKYNNRVVEDAVKLRT